MRIGIIGGSGLYEIEGLSDKGEVNLTTPYGEPSAPYMAGRLGDREILFLPRHGPGHHIPPHKINYRANLWGFKSLGVERIFSFGAVGSLRPEVPPGSIVLADGLIDITCGARVSTFYDGPRVVHIDFTEPYCTQMRSVVLEVARQIGLEVIPGGTYVCTNGPRLETAQEIRFISMSGGDMVGMTGMPEASLARELEICMALVCVVTNYAAGLTGKRLTATEVVEIMNRGMDVLRILLRETVALTPSTRTCSCGEALREAEL